MDDATEVLWTCVLAWNPRRVGANLHATNGVVVEQRQWERDVGTMDMQREYLV